MRAIFVIFLVACQPSPDEQMSQRSGGEGYFLYFEDDMVDTITHAFEGTPEAETINKFRAEYLAANDKIVKYGELFKYVERVFGDAFADPKKLDSLQRTIFRILAEDPALSSSIISKTLNKKSLFAWVFHQDQLLLQEFLNPKKKKNGNHRKRWQIMQQILADDNMRQNWLELFSRDNRFFSEDGVRKRVLDYLNHLMRDFENQDFKLAPAVEKLRDIADHKAFAYVALREKGGDKLFIARKRRKINYLHHRIRRFDMTLNGHANDAALPGGNLSIEDRLTLDAANEEKGDDAKKKVFRDAALREFREEMGVELDKLLEKSASETLLTEIEGKDIGVLVYDLDADEMRKVQDAVQTQLKKAREALRSGKVEGMIADFEVDVDGDFFKDRKQLHMRDLSALNWFKIMQEGMYPNAIPLFKTVDGPNISVVGNSWRSGARPAPAAVRKDSWRRASGQPPKPQRGVYGERQKRLGVRK